MPKVLSSACVALFLLGCSVSAPQEPELVVYVSADEQIAREVFGAFTKSTGVQVLWVGDTESTKTTALVQRLIREKNSPVADVFWSSEILSIIQLANAEMLALHHSKVADAWPEEHRDAEFRWFGFSPRARVIAYNPTQVKKEELPEMWWSYGDAAIADPRFGTTGTHLAVMALYSDEFATLTSSFHRQPLLGGNAATVQAVIDGTATFAMTDSDDVHAAIARGETIAMHYPRHHDGKGGGTLLIPNTVGIIQGCTHPELASAFIDFMLSEEVAELLASSTSHNIPLQPEVAAKFQSLIVEDPLVVDFYKASYARTEAIKQLTESMQPSDK